MPCPLVELCISQTWHKTSIAKCLMSCVQACTNLLECQRKDKILGRMVNCHEQWPYCPDISPLDFFLLTFIYICTSYILLVVSVILRECPKWHWYVFGLATFKFLGRRLYVNTKTMVENHRFEWWLLPALKVLISCFLFFSNFIKNFLLAESFLYNLIY